MLDIGDEIKYRQLKWLGKLARKPDSAVTRKMIGGYVKRQRRVGRPQHSLKRSYIPALKEILPDMCERAALAHWIPKAKDAKSWEERLERWKEGKRQQSQQARPMTRAAARAIAQQQ